MAPKMKATRKQKVEDARYLRALMFRRHTLALVSTSPGLRFGQYAKSLRVMGYKDATHKLGAVLKQLRQDCCIMLRGTGRSSRYYPYEWKNYDEEQLALATSVRTRNSRILPKVEATRNEPAEAQVKPEPEHKQNLQMAIALNGEPVWFDMAASEAFGQMCGEDADLSYQTQALYRTHKTGTYIFNDKTNDSFSVITEAKAYIWLAKNQYFEEVPTQWMEERTV